MCRIPPPAVIHWVSPLVIRPPPPLESWWRNTPSMMYVTVLEPAVRVPGRALGLPRRVLHLAHLVHVDERVQLPQVHAGERPADPGNPHPRTRTGAVVTDTTGRSAAVAASGSGTRGSTRMSSTGHRWHDISSVKPSRPA